MLWLGGKGNLLFFFGSAPPPPLFFYYYSDFFHSPSFLIGNDFLPHLPGLDIFSGALEEVFKLYKKLLPELGGCVGGGRDARDVLR